MTFLLYPLDDGQGWVFEMDGAVTFLEKSHPESYPWCEESVTVRCPECGYVGCRCEGGG